MKDEGIEICKSCSCCYEAFVLYLLLFHSCICSDFAATISRPFGVRYNPYTQSIETLDSKRQIQKLITNINYEIRNLIDAFNKF